MVDLKKASLQLHVDKELQKFQAVKYHGRLYVMTRMGFGLNVAPKIMSKILARVLSLDKDIEAGTDYYIDNIIVNKDVVTVSKAREHLLAYGLTTKEPEPISNARVLGLRVAESNDGGMEWHRDCADITCTGKVTKRELFSVCGKLVGHYPVGSWLRVACGFMKRECNECSWDDLIPASVDKILKEVLERIKSQDPVRGRWSVPLLSSGTVWCDASSLALGVAVEVGGEIVEDAAWLRKDDGNHINVAELEAVIKGVSLAIKWNLTDIKVVTDSATVYGWVQSIVTDSKRPKVGGLGEMLIRRRLSMIAKLIEMYTLSIDMQLVKSEHNLADKLTRVPAKWLSTRTCAAGEQKSGPSLQMLRDLHDTHHLGVSKTLHLAKCRWGEEVVPSDVAKIVDQCHVCRQIDPAPVTWEKGALEVTDTWKRLATDITHYNGVAYLTIIDCGPSRFAIWRRLRNETADSVAQELEQVFWERGAPLELMSDNGPCYKSHKLKTLLCKWNIEHILSCAYRASGNGLVERHHRTIKRMMARSGGTVQEMVYWYNNTPNVSNVIPSNSVYSYTSGTGPEVKGNSTRFRSTQLNPYKLGDIVYIKPVNTKCTTVWKKGLVTALVCNTAAMVNGITRHIGDLRLCHADPKEVETDSVEVSVDSLVENHHVNEPIDPDNVNNGHDIGIGHDAVNNLADGLEPDEHLVENQATRNRKPPAWLADFYTF